MIKLTQGEIVFEEFCKRSHIPFAKINEGKEPTPDYEIKLNDKRILVEIKQLDSDENFNLPVRTRTIGSHIRAKINEARKQMKLAVREQVSSILLIYNNLDPYQLFGTEPHDFISAMYGEPTVILGKGIIDSFNGKNQSLRLGKNDSFSAVGTLKRKLEEIEVTIYENIYAKHPLDFASLPASIKAIRIETH